MISGLSSSGIASAIRTAVQARATMDDMSRQISTGQKVASVKDDGASWARAAAMKSQIAQAEARQTVTTALRGEVLAQTIENDTTRATFETFRDILTRARTVPAGSAARAALHDEFLRTRETLDTSYAPRGAIESGFGMQADSQWGIAASSADTLLNGRTLFGTPLSTNFFSNWISVTFTGSGGVSLRNFNLNTASDTALEGAIELVVNLANNLAPFEQRSGRDQNWLDSLDRATGRDIDRLSSAIGSLTDANMGKVSSARAQADTRQQLAMATLQQAISAYGNFAGGLLGNVQRTQRGALA